MNGEKLQANVESSGMKNSSFLANVETFVSIIGCFLIFVVGLMVVSLCKSCIQDFVKSELQRLKKKLFFGGKIKSYTVGYLQVMISFQVYAATLDMSYFWDHWLLYLPKLAPLLLVVVYPLVVIIVLKVFKKRLSDPRIRGAVGQLYEGVDLKGSSWGLIYYPMFLLRRFIFVMIPVVYVH